MSGTRWPRRCCAIRSMYPTLRSSLRSSQAGNFTPRLGGETARRRETAICSGSPRLLGLFPYVMKGPATWANAAPGQFVPCETERPLLISSGPIRKRTALKVEDEGFCRLVDRVPAKVADATLHNSFVLLSVQVTTRSPRAYFVRQTIFGNFEWPPRTFWMPNRMCISSR